MVDVMMTIDEAMAREDVDRAKIAATTEADVQRYMREDGEDPDGDDEEDLLNVKAAQVRARTGLSQVAFAEAIGLPVKTWRNWEQGRTRIEPAGVALLKLLAADTKGALGVLSPAQK